MLRRAIPVLLLLLGAAGLAALAITRPEPQPIAPQEKEWVVAVHRAAPRRLHPTLTLYARVDSPRAAGLTAALEAEVVEVPAREGRDAVRGEVLVRLDERDARLALAQREADVAELRAELANAQRRHENDRAAMAHEQRLLELAEREVQRAQRLATRDMGSAAQLDQALEALERQALAIEARRLAIAQHDSETAMQRARLARAEAELDLARLELERTLVRAPFDGRIARVTVALGERVRPGQALVTIYDHHALELRAQVPTRHLASLRRSLEQGRPIAAEARVDGMRLAARLDRLGAQVETGRGGADALFRLEGDGGHPGLELGRVLALDVALPAVDEVVAIPAEALYGSDRIYVLDQGRMRGLQVIRVGEHRDERGETRLLVRSPRLAPGTPIVATQLPNAVDGLKVRPASEPPRPAPGGQPPAG